MCVLRGAEMKKKLGLTEVVHVCGAKKCAQVAAICDTGAMRTSVDESLAKELDFGESVRTTSVKNPSVDKRFKRPVVNVHIEISGMEFDVDASIQDRSHMTHKIIVGRDILFGNFVVDVSMTHDSNKLAAIKDKDQLEVKVYGKC